MLTDENAAVEAEVREVLALRAGSVRAPDDPLPGVRRKRRALRRHRVAVSGLWLALAGVASVVAPLPSWVPAVRVAAAAPGSEHLLSGPTRGSLAGDTAFLDGLRRSFTGSRDPEGLWRADPARTRVAFAGDVPGGRRALLVVRLRLGPVEAVHTQWMTGPPGARPQDMEPGGNADPAPVHAAMDLDPGRPSPLVVLAPPGATVTWSPEVRFGPDGRARRAWRPVATQDGAWVDDVREGRYSQVRIRVVLARTVLYEGPVGGVEQGGPRDDDPGPAVLDPALRAARGRPDPALAQIALYGLLDAAGLSSRTSRVGVLWGGRVADQQAVLVTVRTPDGGLLVDGVTGSVDSRDLRLRQVVPADEWGTRAFAWVVPPREQSRGGRTVVVVAPRAAVRAELVQDGTVVPVALTDGAGSADVPREGPPVEVRVVDAEGRVLDARPVLEAEWYHEPVIEP